jgi:hypothetical protein
MPNDDLKPALRMALRVHEIGSKSPYQLFFAGKGNSGGSFGFMQGDLAARQPNVTATFRKVLAAAGIAPAKIESLRRALAVHIIVNPLSREDTDLVNAALLRGRADVDAMDEEILQGVYGDLDTCIKTARDAGRTIDPKALLFAALWINMSGPPTKLLTWLKGGDPNLSRPVPPPGAVVTAPQIETYLRATDYYVNNPGNIPHLLESVDAGARLLPPGHLGGAMMAAVRLGDAGELLEDGALAAAMAAPPPYAAPAGDHLIYEQATGRMLISENGHYDTLAVGYSGSLSRHARNDPDQQCVVRAGPIPRGLYHVGQPEAGPSPYSLRLTPDPSNDMCGRSGFLIHGDSISHPGDASDGCIILTRRERETVVSTGLKGLVVVARIST